jgi:hypothetical protein
MATVAGFRSIRSIIRWATNRMEVDRPEPRRRPARHPSHNMSAAPRLLMFASVSALWLAPCTAYAYIDPNAGGMLFQLLAPVFAAAVGAWLFLRRWIAEAVRNLWHRLTGRRPE